VGMERIIFEPSLTVAETLGRNETRRFPKYPAVIPRVEVKEVGTSKVLKTVRLVFVRGVVAKGTLKTWSTTLPLPWYVFMSRVGETVEAVDVLLS